MATPPKPVTFLARDSYRQRRLRDVAWVLPLIGAILLAVPLLWPREGEIVHQTSAALTFLFVVWLGLIALALWLAQVMAQDPPGPSPDPEG